MGRVSTAGHPVPIARLLAMAYRTLIDTLHARLRAEDWTDVRRAYGFVLLATRSEPTTVTDLAELLGVTKQAASKLVESMVDSGYLLRTTDPDDARIKRIALAERGRRLLQAVERIYTDLEGEWAAVIGVRSVEQIRRSLTAVLLATHDGELPVVRPTV
ncbi:MAG: MarR family winged helix-turn-helix transcriptional regulator [Acidimicrobiia bacterium]